MPRHASDEDSWVDLSPGSAFHIGAYFPGSIAGRSETVTVFWKGHLSFESVRDILINTETLYDGSADYRASLICYGEEREEIRSIGGSLVGGLSLRTEAVRAEFSGSIGDLTLWATLFSASDDPEGLDENIGFCVNPAFFKGRVRDLIGYAIRETVGGAEQIVDASLGRLSDLIRRGRNDVMVAM